MTRNDSGNVDKAVGAIALITVGLPSAAELRQRQVKSVSSLYKAPSLERFLR